MLVSPEEQQIAKDMAMSIDKLLGDFQQPVIVNALAISLVTAGLIDFVEEDFRPALTDLIQKLTQEIVGELGKSPGDTKH